MKCKTALHPQASSVILVPWLGFQRTLLPMGKRAIWLEDDLEKRLKQIHAAMQGDPVLRHLRLKWVDALKLLLRMALEKAELEYFHGLPSGVDPKDALKALEADYAKQRAVLELLVREADFAQKEAEHDRLMDQERDQRQQKPDE